MDRVIHGVYRREVAKLNIPNAGYAINVGSMISLARVATEGHPYS